MQSLVNTNLATFLSDNGFPGMGKPFPFAEHYKQIGSVFSTLEASTLRVGVLIPFPTSKIRSLFSPFQETVNDYLKVNLVNINTEILESYLDDLKQLRLDEESNNHLHLTNLSELERHGTFAIFLFIVLAFSLVLHNIPGLTVSGMGLGLSITMLVVLWLSKLGPGSEQFRRNTFIYYLDKEIMRRKGVEKGQPLSPVRAD